MSSHYLHHMPRWPRVHSVFCWRRVLGKPCFVSRGCASFKITLKIIVDSQVASESESLCLWTQQLINLFPFTTRIQTAESLYILLAFETPMEGLSK